MLKLIPAVKHLEIKEGVWNGSAITLKNTDIDHRLQTALADMTSAEGGIPLEISLEESENEAYKLQIDEMGIHIIAGSEAGAFWAIQTLKQIFANGDDVPYLEISDKPDFEHRGFYHDITRGKI
ncbi:MAG: hypothetical protein IIX07_09755, partial [Lachnospiraceae bacterium]|nr:hypothetical protein [Lachnospiraceae bacterium]